MLLAAATFPVNPVTTTKNFEEFRRRVTVFWNDEIYLVPVFFCPWLFLKISKSRPQLFYFMSPRTHIQIFWKMCLGPLFRYFGNLFWTPKLWYVMLENFRSGEWQVGKIFQFKQILALILHKCSVNHFTSYSMCTAHRTVQYILTGLRGKMSL